MAHLVNVGAYDALDIVWLRAWDECPLALSAEQQTAEHRFEESQFEAWCETWADYE